MIQIASLLTCYNRKEKTISCINDVLNQINNDNVNIDIYVVDGGSTDNTPDAIKSTFANVNIKICNGLFWAGGMREAWKEAISQKEYDFYWLINDDTHIYKDCLKELIETHIFSVNHYGMGGIYIGTTVDPLTKTFTYGGRKLVTSNKSKSVKIIPNGKDYQICDLGNANIFLVSKDVKNKIGILSSKYTHGIADYDYTLRARKEKIPVLISKKYNGECINDHGKNWKPQKTSLKQRISFLYSPKGLAYNEYLYYIRTYFPDEYLAIKTKLWLKTLFPFLWSLFKK